MKQAIYFTKNICVKCGKENGIYLYDYFNRRASNISSNTVGLYAKCIYCDQEYFPIWNTETDEPVFHSKESTIEAFKKEYVNVE